MNRAALLLDGFFIGLTHLTGSVFDIQLVHRDILSEVLKRRTTMITKRLFLKGSAGFLGSTLLCKHLNGFESYGKNIIESGKDFEDTLFYNLSTDSFELGTWDISKWGAPKYVRDELPTWSEYLEEVWEKSVDPNDLEITEEIYIDFGVKPDDYEQLIDPKTWFFEFEHSSPEFRSWAPPCCAFDYLMNLDLGPELKDDCNPIDDEHGLFFLLITKDLVVLMSTLLRQYLH